MSKLNAIASTITLASTLWFAAAAQADTSAAAEASQAQTAQAMRFEGVDHLIPAPRNDKSVEARKADAKPKKAPHAPQLEQAERKPAEIKASLSRADVIAELQRARANGEMDRIHAELGHVPAPVGRAAVEPTRLAALQTR